MPMVSGSETIGVLKQDHPAKPQLKPLLISFAVFILLCGGTLFIAFTYLGSEDAISKRESAADFRLRLIDGREFQLSDHRGKPVLISFFASWCLPCIEEAPIINKAFDEYGRKGVIFVAIAVSDEDKQARQFVLKNVLRFPAGLDDSGEIHKAYGISGIPTIVFIGKDGMANHIHSGGVTERSLKYELDSLL